MTVVYFGSREIYQDFPSAVRSLLDHTQARVITITEDSDPFYDLPVVNIKYDNKWFNDTNTRTKWKQFGTIRAALSKILPEHDLILSIDVDTIVTDDISELFDIDMEDYHVAMVREEGLAWEGRPYYNNGICLMNLKQIREDKVDDQMIAELNRHFHRYVCQDVMQMYCHIKELPSDYNVSKFTLPTDHPKILHFADRTDWRDLPEVQKYR